jgi:hypothetical protein
MPRDPETPGERCMSRARKRRLSNIVPATRQWFAVGLDRISGYARCESRTRN